MKRFLLILITAIALAAGLSGCAGGHPHGVRPTGPAPLAHGHFGIDTDFGVCAKPALAKELQKEFKLAPTDQVPLVLPNIKVTGDQVKLSGFDGTIGMPMGPVVHLLRDTRNLTPCAPQERVQCTIGEGQAIKDDKIIAKVYPGTKVEVNVPFKFGQLEITYVTWIDDTPVGDGPSVRHGESVQIDTPLAPCPKTAYAPAA